MSVWQMSGTLLGFLLNLLNLRGCLTTDLILSGDELAVASVSSTKGKSKIDV